MGAPGVPAKKLGNPFRLRTGPEVPSSRRHLPRGTGGRTKQGPAASTKVRWRFGEPCRYRNERTLSSSPPSPASFAGGGPATPITCALPSPGRFAVPLCRLHHRELHRSRNESLWWKKLGIDPIKIAAQLWDRTRSFRPPETGTPVAPPAGALPLPETGAKGGAGRVGRAAREGTRGTGKEPQRPQPPAPEPSRP